MVVVMETPCSESFVRQIHEVYRKKTADFLHEIIDFKNYQEFWHTTLEDIDAYINTHFEIPVERTYKIRFDDNALYLVRDLKEINLTDIFPHIRFEQSNTFTAKSHKDNEKELDAIKYDVSEIDTLWFMPSIAHEIWHTFEDDKLTHLKEINKITKQANEKKGLLDPLRDNTDELKKIDKREKRELLIRKSMCERAAWKRSLIVNETLKKEGFDPYEWFTGMSHVQQYIDLRLLRYKILSGRFAFCDDKWLFLTS